MTMLGFEALDLNKDLRRHRGGIHVSEPRKERLFFVHVVAGTRLGEVMQSGFNSATLLGVEYAAACPRGDKTEDSEEALDPAVTIFEHADGIVESAIWFCADLDRHCHTSTGRRRAE